MADNNTTWAIPMFHYHGFLTRSDVTSRFIGHDTHRDLGRADIFIARNGQAANIEVKNGGLSWRHFPKWDKKRKEWIENWHFGQRLWAVMSMSDPFRTPYYIYLTLGENPASWNPEKYHPRKSWLIPFEVVWEAVHRIEMAGKKSMPYKIRKGINRVYQDNKWSAIDLFKDYELEWQKTDSLVRPAWYQDTAGKPYGAFWTVPEDHIFHRYHIACSERWTPDTDRIDAIKASIKSSIPVSP